MNAEWLAKTIAAIESATDNIAIMSDDDMRRIGNAACFLNAAIMCERDRRES